MNMQAVEPDEPDKIFQLLKLGSPEERQDFARKLPPSPFLDVSMSLLGSDRPGMIIAALGPTITSYCAGSNPEIGAALALAAHRYAVELYETTPDHGLIPTTLSGLASSYANACNLQGRSQEVIDFASKYVPFYERKVPEPINVRSLKLARTAALMNLNQLDKAAEYLDDPTLPGNFATDFELDRQKKRLAKLRGVVTEDRDAPAAPDSFPKLAQGALKELVGGLPQSELLGGLVDKLDLNNRLDPNKPADFATLIELLRVGKQTLTRGSSDDNDITVRQRIIEASSIFMNPEPPRAQIEASENELRWCLEWGREREILELQTDALWGIYLCRSRSDDPSGAADALLDLRAIVEETRSAIEDPIKRGGAFSTYPHLFPALCEKLHAAGRIPEMLEAIEANKGRGIADLLTKRAGHAVPDADIYGAVTRIPELCKAHGFHYVTYLVDQDQTYAVLVLSSGTMFVPQPIGLTRQAIRDAAFNVQLGSKAKIDPSKKLAPLLGWLEPLIADRTLAPNDHLCISADDDLANVPFGYLRLGKRRVADVLSTSRIQNAFHLAHVLDSKPTKPSGYLGVAVPARENLESDLWNQFRAALYEPIEYLDSQLSGKAISDKAATLRAVTGRPRRNAVLHFSTHGDFPLPQTPQKPFEHAGLLLSDGASLPTLEEAWTDVLTPRYILETKLDLTGSHISMMACVSGLSREGIGGDALGMEWALLQAGASSVLSSHWSVQADTAAEFLTTFYRYWIELGKPRRDAVRATIADMRKKGGKSGDTVSWAAFSLTGDWR
jgi:hypothetical protein